MHYPSPDAARRALALLPSAADPSIEIHATRLYPWVCYGRADIDTFPIVLSLHHGGGEATQPLPSDATFLGFDVIGLVYSPRADHIATLNYISFSCAPLSCNHEAANYQVNRWCLLDNIEDARRATENFAAEEPEPVPYMIAEVWRCGE
jgi:hypothetical protein